jgi:hypothetical protein
MRLLVVPIACLLLLGGCGENGETTCAWQTDAIAAATWWLPFCDDAVCISDPIQVVPSGKLPSRARTQEANNNLDVVSHKCRVFLAFRTAPSHFASAEARLYVVSSEDQRNWRFEGGFALGTDLREPRLLSYRGKLFLYFGVLGTDPLDFQPQGMMVSEYLGPERWTEPEWFYGEGFMPWRTKVVDGVPYLLAYVGGENIYDVNGEPIRVHWLTTRDGYDWTPVVPGQPVVIEGGASETDFVFLRDGTLIAVSRNEAGDEQTGWGSKICRAEADSLGDWRCVGDTKKYDSPLMFRLHNIPYLIARRNLSVTGDYYLGHTEKPPRDQTIDYQLDYWNLPKRTSLWKVDPDSLTVEFVMDFPSRGDTCFPGLLTVGAGLYEVYNYTSPLEGEDLSWIDGQTGPTRIVRTGLKLE